MALDLHLEIEVSLPAVRHLSAILGKSSRDICLCYQAV